jgi:hypothetical protein
MASRPPNPLKIYCMGPGFGESIVLHLPCGGWGVVDCFQGARGGTVDFLQKMGVERLKFFCLTHPHDDHYRGTHKLFKRYTGKIENVWRFSGLTVAHLQNLALASRARDNFGGDREAGELALDYLRMVESMGRERDRIGDRHYFQVSYPRTLLEEEKYKIEVKRPGNRCLERFQEKFARIVIKSTPLLLSDEGGESINSISVVLGITFGTARVVLLGDAQGPESSLDIDGDQGDYAVVKIAHHGSPNGLGAEILTRARRRISKVDHAILTRYSRSRLPSDDMERKYGQGCVKLVKTPEGPSRRPRRVIPAMANARILNETVNWVGLEVSHDGEIRQFQ